MRKKKIIKKEEKKIRNWKQKWWFQKRKKSKNLRQWQQSRQHQCQQLEQACHSNNNLLLLTDIGTSFCCTLTLVAWHHPSKKFTKWWVPLILVGITFSCKLMTMTMVAAAITKQQQWVPIFASIFPGNVEQASMKTVFLILLMLQ